MIDPSHSIPHGYTHRRFENLLREVATSLEQKGTDNKHLYMVIDKYSDTYYISHSKDKGDAASFEQITELVKKILSDSTLFVDERIKILHSYKIIAASFRESSKDSFSSSPLGFFKSLFFKSKKEEQIKKAEKLISTDLEVLGGRTARVDAKGRIWIGKFGVGGEFNGTVKLKNEKTFELNGVFTFTDDDKLNGEGEKTVRSDHHFPMLVEKGKFKNGELIEGKRWVNSEEEEVPAKVSEQPASKANEEPVLQPHTPSGESEIKRQEPLVEPHTPSGESETKR